MSGLYILQSTCSSSRWVVFEAGRTIKSFSDGKTEAGKMISLGTEPSLEVRSVTSGQGLEGMVVMGCGPERGCFSLWVWKAGHEPELQHLSILTSPSDCLPWPSEGRLGLLEVPPSLRLDQSLQPLSRGRDSETWLLARFPEYRGASFAVPGTSIPFVEPGSALPLSET